MKAIGITDGSAGMIAQVRALAEAMFIDIEMHVVQVSSPWRYLPNCAADMGLAKILPVASHTLPDAPLIISCGRKGALVAASLKTKAKKVHIQDPQMSPRHFDVIIAMEHDHLRGPNILQSPLALHAITAEKLEASRVHWQPKFEHLPRPWNAVLIGGSTNKYLFTKPAMNKLITELEAIEGSLLITTSRRTGEDNIKLLSKHFAGRNNKAFLYTGELENPYLGLLACADRIYVTNDSVNMMSEALASGKPISILSLMGHENTKPARFAEKLHTLNGDPKRMMKDLAESVSQMLA